MSYVLLVEDDLNTAEMVIRLLTAEGIAVQRTARGYNSARMARQQRPALILMDFNLPDVDGRTMILQLKKQLGGNEAPPIVAFTARTGESEVRLAARFGAAAFVSKPFVPLELLALVRKLMLDKRSTGEIVKLETPQNDVQTPARNVPPG